MLLASPLCRVTRHVCKRGEELLQSALRISCLCLNLPFRFSRSLQTNGPWELGKRVPELMRESTSPHLPLPIACRKPELIQAGKPVCIRPVRRCLCRGPAQPGQWHRDVGGCLSCNKEKNNKNEYSLSKYTEIQRAG